jgi:hypothetical protein
MICEGYVLWCVPVTAKEDAAACMYRCSHKAFDYRADRCRSCLKR